MKALPFDVIQAAARAAMPIIYDTKRVGILYLPRLDKKHRKNIIRYLLSIAELVSRESRRAELETGEAFMLAEARAIVERTVYAEWREGDEFVAFLLRVVEYFNTKKERKVFPDESNFLINLSRFVGALSINSQHKAA